jgi:hypothetical protein
MTGFRPFFNAATGEWIEFTAVPEDIDGQLVRFSWRSVPGGVITEHVHPRQLAYESRLITPGAPPPAEPGQHWHGVASGFWPDAAAVPMPAGIGTRRTVALRQMWGSGRPP